MLDAAAIIAEAEAAVGIADGDAGVAENLDRLVAELGVTFPMSPEGEARSHAQLLMDATNRLASLKWVTDHPEIADEPIDDPVFLTGLPRSGTTYLQYLFDRDPRYRLIRTWESVMPSPPPGYDPGSVARRREAWAEMQKASGHFEGFEAIHLYDEDGSDECHAFLEQSYGAAGLHNLYRVPAYFDWVLDGIDLEQTYRIHMRQLQCLQWRCERKPWALKYPNHVLAMDTILRVHPSARFVMTHRDPVQNVASLSKLTWNLRSMRAAQPVDPHEVGRDMLAFMERHVERILEFEEGPHADRVIHVDYYALAADPVGEMTKIHVGLGIDTPDEVARAVADWHAANPKNARGKNDYSLAQYGLDADEVAARFADYTNRFSVPGEREGIARFGPAQ
jgi:hypothetical protein